MVQILQRWILLWAIGGLSLSAFAQNQEHKLRMAREAWETAAEQGWIQGVRSVELIRADLLLVTLDGGITGSLSPDNQAAVAAMGGPEAYDFPQAFRIHSDTDPAFKAGLKPIKVGRASYEGRNCITTKTMWPSCINPVWWHEYYLFLPKPMTSGHSYVVTPSYAKEKDPRIRYSDQVDYDVETTITRTIKINQVGYSVVASQRYAYLGWWAGSEGAVDYSNLSGLSFDVIDESDGQVVFKGTRRLRAKLDEHSGEQVYECDISSLGPGSYHIRIPGLGRSHAFHVGGQSVFDLYYYTQRAFFHQRCGQELREPWTWVKRPACHLQVWTSGGLGLGIIPGSHDRRKPDVYQANPGETAYLFRGGYHDAADFDTFTYHLPATEHALTMYSLYPNAFKDGDLDIPESGNGIPDVLDEAAWGLSFYLDYQYANGAVPLGRINQCDARKQNIEGGKEAPMPPHGIIPPMRDSTPVFAAVAARFARVYRRFDPMMAERYLQAAKSAFAYASVRTPEDVWREYTTEAVPLVRHEKRDQNWIPSLCWAAAELLVATGDKTYNQYLVTHEREAYHWYGQHYRFWAYLQAPKGFVHQKIQSTMRSKLLDSAKKLVTRTHESAYRMGNGKGTAVGWGAAQGAPHGNTLIRAYAITGDKAYLDAACLNADFHLGANPLGKCFLTNMGIYHPRRPEISWYLYSTTEPDVEGPTVKGIPIYGIGPKLKSYPGKEHWPLWRSWRDVWGNYGEIYSEFTLHQTVGPAAYLYGSLYSLEHKAGLLPAKLKGDPLAR